MNRRQFVRQSCFLAGAYSFRNLVSFPDPADSASNNRIRKISATGLVTTIAGNGNAGLVNGTGITAEFNKPRALVLDKQGKYLYVIEQANNCIRRILLF